MLLERFIRVKIWDSTNTTVEYDNYDDTLTQPDWGVSAGSVNINKVICDTELSFGDTNASKLELQIFGLYEETIDPQTGEVVSRTNIPILGRKIQVIVEDDIQNDNYLVNEDDDILSTEDDESLHGGYSVTHEQTYLFTGFVESSKTDYESTYTDITAYDWFYFKGEQNVYQWLSSYLYVHPDGELGQLMQAFIIQFVPANMRTSDLYTNLLVNPTIYRAVVQTLLESKELITIKTMFKCIYEIQCWCPYIDGEGIIRVKKFVSNMPTTSIAPDTYEHENSTWEDYTTYGIDYLRIYSNGNLITAGGSLNYDNAYDIPDALLLSRATVTNTVFDTLLNNMRGLEEFTPFEIHMIVSDLSLQLGDFISTEKGDGYIMEIEYSGSLLVDQTIKCNAQGQSLTPKIT